MKIVAVGDGLFEDGKGGGRRYLSEVRTRLCARGHTVDVVVPRASSVLPDEEVRAGSRILRHDLGAGGLLTSFIGRYRSAQRAFGAVTAGGCDLVNVHFAQTGFAALQSASAAGLPVVFNFQGPWPGEVWVERRARARIRPQPQRMAGDLLNAAVFGVMYFLERSVARRANRFIVLSVFSRDTLGRWYGVARERVAVIPGGVDTERFTPHPDRQSLRSELGLPRDSFVLFTARRLVSRMGIELLLAAIKEAAPHVPVRLYVAGTGPRREAMERTAVELGVDGLVTWLGPVPDETLVSFYQAADLVVVPTVAYEGFGLVTVEALACGTPVVASPVAASPEILNGLDSGLVSGAPTSSSLAEAILRACASAPDRDRCRAYAVANYSWDAIIPRVEGEFERTAGLA